MIKSASISRVQEAIDTPFSNIGNGFASTDVQSAIEELKTINLSQYKYITDFIPEQKYTGGLLTGTSAGFNGDWLYVNNGGSITVGATVEALHQGIVSLNAENRQEPVIQWTQSQLYFDQYLTATFQWLIKTPALLPTALQNYVVRVGAGNDPSGNSNDWIDGVYFEFPLSGTTAIQYKTANSSTRTTVSSGVVWTASTWYLLKAVVTSTGVTYTINNSNSQIITTNIPINIPTGMQAKLAKTAGRTVINFYVDMFTYESVYSVNRW